MGDFQQELMINLCLHSNTVLNTIILNHTLTKLRRSITTGAKPTTRLSTAAVNHDTHPRCI